MDPSAWELLFKTAIGLMGILGAAILKTTWDEIRSVRDEHTALVASLPDTYARREEHAILAASLPGTYARRDDVKDGFTRIEGTLSRIEGKLDGKVDKD